MKIMITILSLLILFAGLLPFLQRIHLLPEKIPTSGVYYSALIIIIGAIGLVYGIINKMLMGFERTVTIIITILTILGGIIPLISSIVPKFIPTSGPFYSLIIIIIGIIGLIYGILALA